MAASIAKRTVCVRIVDPPRRPRAAPANRRAGTHGRAILPRLDQEEPRAHAALFHPFDVAQVPRTASRPFVPDERLAADEVHRHRAEGMADAAWPCLVECKSRQLGENIDAARYHA